MVLPAMAPPRTGVQKDKCHTRHLDVGLEAQHKRVTADDPRGGRDERADPLKIWFKSVRLHWADQLKVFDPFASALSANRSK